MVYSTCPRGANVPPTYVTILLKRFPASNNESATLIDLLTVQRLTNKRDAKIHERGGRRYRRLQEFLLAGKTIPILCNRPRSSITYYLVNIHADSRVIKSELRNSILHRRISYSAINANESNRCSVKNPAEQMIFVSNGTGSFRRIDNAVSYLSLSIVHAFSSQTYSRRIFNARTSVQLSCHGAKRVALKFHRNVSGDRVVRIRINRVSSGNICCTKDDSSISTEISSNFRLERYFIRKS